MCIRDSSSGVHDLMVVNIRYQSAEGPDVDGAWHVRGFSESLEPDTLTYLGQGDLDSTSGAGNDIRFDFASMGILPDGGSFIAYHDSTQNVTETPSTSNLSPSVSPWFNWAVPALTSD